MTPHNSSNSSSQVISFGRVALVTLADVLFFSISNPSSGNSLMIIAGCALAALGVYVWCSLLVRLVANFWLLSLRSQQVLALFSSAAIMFLLLLQSIGQLSWRDVLAALPLAVVLYLYLSYRANIESTPGH